MKFLNSLFVTLIVINLSSCATKDSNDIAPGSLIYQDLKVTFNISKDETLTKATFREGNSEGTRLILSEEASLIVNQRPTDYYSNVGNYFYHQDFDEITDVNFLFKKNNFISFYNSIEKAEMPSLKMSKDIDTVNLDGTSVVSWSSGPLIERESIHFSIRQRNNSGGSGYSSSKGITSVQLGKIITGGLDKGAAELHISRQIEINSLIMADGDSQNGRRIIETAIIHPIILKK